MNKGVRGTKADVDRCHPRTKRANFDRQERTIEKSQRQLARRDILIQTETPAGVPLTRQGIRNLDGPPQNSRRIPQHEGCFHAYHYVSLGVDGGYRECRRCGKIDS